MRCLLALFTLALTTRADLPPNLTVEGLPPISEQLRADASRYLEFRSASLSGWAPKGRGILILTRFAEVAQMHQVEFPGGARHQLTFGAEPVRGVEVQPGEGRCAIISQDTGGSEFHQLYRYDFADGRLTLLTDGKSRNGSAHWSRDGKQIAYTSTRRTGKDNDIRIMDPNQPASDREVLAVSGGGWHVLDWAPDGQRLLLGEAISANERHLHILDLRSGTVVRLSPKVEKPVAWRGGQFTLDGAAVVTLTDREGEFQQLARISIADGSITPILEKPSSGDVEEFALSPDGRWLAWVENLEGACVLKARSLDGRVAFEYAAVKDEKGSVAGVISGIAWHPGSGEVGFAVSAPSGPMDVFSLRIAEPDKPVRWTRSEMGGLPALRGKTEIIRISSFDGLRMSGFLYRPDPVRFPGPRPCVISIHGGPESQSQPEFIGRWNYLPEEMGVALFYPNVRGSSGFGKTFLTLDNGYLRENSVRDIGAFIAELKKDPALDAGRFAVLGGSYGGYMTLASLIHHGADLRCGVNMVGISNFLTFLKNTQDYRRDLRRVEYGDERDPQMAEFLARISPTRRAAEIRKPLFIVQGANDPRVPVTEARQMRDAVRDAKGTVWYLEAADEGHGFAKKRNADVLFLSILTFFQKHLLP